MATVYSEWARAQYPFGATATRCYLTTSDAAIIESPTSCYVNIEGAVQSSPTGALEGQGVRCTVGFLDCATRKGQSTAASGAMDWDRWVAKVSDYWYFNRTHSDYQVTFFSEYTGEGWDPVKQSGHVERKVTIPAKPSYAVKFNANGGSGAPSTATKWHGEALTLPAAKPARAHHTFAGWATSSNAAAADYQAGGTYAADAAVTLYAVWRINPPAAPTGCTATRETDYRADVSWTLGANAAATYAAVLIERSIDGAAWSQVASVAGSATAWSDAGIASNHAYRYRVRASNETGQSAYATAPETLYTTPAAPVSVAAARTGEASVALTIDNPANTATALEYEYAATTAGGGTSVTVQGARVTSATANPGGGTWYFRARNTRGALVSDWSPWSDPVVTICPPAAPTLTAPAQGFVVEMGDASALLFAWAHNAPDGSAQTAAEVRWRVGSAAWKTLTATAAQELTADVSAAGLNATVEWQVRTKGAHADWSPWSDNRSFSVRKAPTVSFATPSAPIANTPVSVSIAYSDPSGSIADCVLTVTDSHGASVLRKEMGPAASCEIPSSEWLPKDSETYTFRADVRSTSSLTSSAETRVAVDFILPIPCAPSVSADPESGEASVVLNAGSGVGLAEAVAYSVWRISDAGSVLLADRVAAGTAVLDRFAPLNVAYSYKCVSFAASGAANEVTVDAVVETPWWFVLFGGGAARAMWEPSGSRTPSRTRDELLERDGREWPILIQGRNKSLKVEFSGWVETKDEADAFATMALASGDKVYKGLKGEVWHCHAEVSISDSYEYGDDSADVSVTLTRVSGGDL